MAASLRARACRGQSARSDGRTARACRSQSARSDGRAARACRGQRVRSDGRAARVCSGQSGWMPARWVAAPAPTVPRACAVGE